MANHLDNAEIVPIRVPSGRQARVEIRYRAEQAGTVLVDYNAILFDVTPDRIAVPASQAGFVVAQVTIKRRTAQRFCVMTFHLFNSDVDAVEVT